MRRWMMVLRAATVALTVSAVAERGEAAIYNSVGSVSRFYGSNYGGQASEAKWSFLGAGQDTAAVWGGVAVTMANAVWPEFNGEWYLRGGAATESWELWTSAVGGTMATTLNTGVSDSYGIPGGYILLGHPGFVQGTDTINTGSDPRTTIVGKPSYMWAPGSTNGNQTPGITTIEVKLPGLSQYTGTQVELVENFWSELDNQTYYLQYLRNDGAATRHLLWKDSAFTIPVLPDNMNAIGDFVTSAGGNASGLWSGFLSSARDGRFVTPQQQTEDVVPEPTTITIWSLLGTLGITVGWFRRRRAA